MIFVTARPSFASYAEVPPFLFSVSMRHRKEKSKRNSGNLTGNITDSAQSFGAHRCHRSVPSRTLVENDCRREYKYVDHPIREMLRRPANKHVSIDACFLRRNSGVSPRYTDQGAFQ